MVTLPFPSSFIYFDQYCTTVPPGTVRARKKKKKKKKKKKIERDVSSRDGSRIFKN